MLVYAYYPNPIAFPTPVNFSPVPIKFSNN